MNAEAAPLVSALNLQKDDPPRYAKLLSCSKTLARTILCSQMTVRAHPIYCTTAVTASPHETTNDLRLQLQGMQHSVGPLDPSSIWLRWLSCSIRQAVDTNTKAVICHPALHHMGCPDRPLQLAGSQPLHPVSPTQGSTMVLMCMWYGLAMTTSMAWTLSAQYQQA